MEKQYEKKITWTIKNFSSLKSDQIYSDQFVVGGCKWRLLAYPKGYNDDKYFYLFLDVADSESLPCGWRRHAKYRLTVVNQLSEKLSKVSAENPNWFDQKTPAWGFRKMLTLVKLNAKDGGFLVNDEVKIAAEVEVLEVIEKSDVLEETLSVVDINGFQVLYSQVKSVRHLFERHPDIASDFRTKNQHLRNTCMNFLLGLIETLCQSLKELSIDDLVEAEFALTYLKDAGFKVDWLEKIKLDEVVQKKKKERLGLARLQEMKDDLFKQKQKCSDMEELVKKEEAELSATISPLSFDDVV